MQDYEIGSLYDGDLKRLEERKKKEGTRVR